MVRTLQDDSPNIPTVLFFKGGKLVDKMVGAANKAKFDEKFKALLG